MTEEPFALDRIENPHPRMRLRALEYRRRARIVEAAVARGETRCTSAQYGILIQWEVYLEAMVDATGATPGELEAWLDRDLDPWRPVVDYQLRGLDE